MNAQQDPAVNIEVLTPAALGCKTFYDQITALDASGEEISSEEYEEELVLIQCVYVRNMRTSN